MFICDNSQITKLNLKLLVGETPTKYKDLISKLNKLNYFKVRLIEQCLLDDLLLLGSSKKLSHFEI